MNTIGIEKINIYPSSLKLNLRELARHRKESFHYYERNLLVKERSVAPLWEDTVTMVVNSANSMLNEEDKSNIGLFIVATETGLDQEKSISTWAHRYLDLPSNCRVIELKIACHAGAAALKMAESWITLNCFNNKKALIVCADISHNMVNKGKMEYSLGVGAIALLISEKPDLAIIETGRSGIHTQDVTDVIRPLPWKEIAFDVEESLFSYMDGLEYTFENYLKCVPDKLDKSYFDYYIYHLPFPGIARDAHKILMELLGEFNYKNIEDSFIRKVLPSLYYPQKIGATYTGSIFLALFSLIKFAENLNYNNRIGLYSYGSGSCAEFLSLFVGESAKSFIVKQAEQLDELLDRRYLLSVSEYEQLENTRTKVIQLANFVPDKLVYKDCYKKNYMGKDLLTLAEIKQYKRYYEFI